MATTYSDYFDLKEQSPEINPSTIKNPENDWKYTYPHETFIALLRQAERMLARENEKAKHSLWIHGAYGTGKSRIAWTLRNLLTCSPTELDAYFDEYDVLQNEKDLRTKLLGHKRQGKIIAAFRYGSDNIDSVDALVMAVYRSLTEALDAENIPYDTGQTMRGSIIRWLEISINREHFTKIIKTEPYCFDGNFANRTADDILTILKGAEEASSLLKSILKVAQTWGLTGFKFTLEDLKKWIRETIETNNLKAMILVWDEFSAFFKNNKNRLDSFQGLNELSGETPFNFVIVTHFTDSIFANGDQAADTVRDRFEKQNIEMPESIAFRLIAHALKIKSEHKDDWQALAEDLNSRMVEVRPKVAKMLKGVSEDDFCKMLPFHPYAALVLKNIARLFDSNQRSMFNFIADNAPDLYAFQWFIASHEPENVDLLSVDMLWEYFYRTGHGKGSHSNLIGKSNLDQMVRAILDVYPSQESKLMQKEQRVLKTVLIFQALAKKLNNVPEFLGTEENLRLTFEGIDGLETGVGLTIANALVTKKILFTDEINGKKVFQAPMSMQGRDIDEIGKLQQQKIDQTRTKDLIGTFQNDDLLPLTPALKSRFILRITAPETFTAVLNKLIAEESCNYKMKALLVLARTSDDAYAAQSCIAKAITEPRANGIIFIDATANNLAQEAFEKWAENMAKANYYMSKDEGQSKIALRDANSIIQNWGEAIRDGIFQVYSQKDPKGVACPKGDDVIFSMQTAVRAKYPLAFDFFSSNLPEALFKSANATSITAGVLGGRANLPPRSSCVLELKQEAELLNGAQSIAEYWQKSKDLPISQLKRNIDQMIGKAFAPGGPGKIAIGDIVDFLISKGFMPTNLSGYLCGFLLKEYASSAFRFSDENGIGGPMTPDDLQKIISGYFKKLNGLEPRYRDWFIEVLTEEQRIFADAAKNIFRLQTNDSIEAVAAQISTKVKDFQYPLWCFNALPEAISLERFIEKFTLLLNPVNAKGANSGTIATEIGQQFKACSEAEAKLTDLFTKENAQRAMNAWLDEFEAGDFRRLAAEIHASDPLADIRRCFSLDGVWLWNQATGEEEIGKVVRDYRIVAESMRRGFITQANSMTTCLDAWKEKSKTLRMPCITLTSIRHDLKNFLSLLLDIAKGSYLEQSEKRDGFLKEITMNGDLIRDFFGNNIGLFKTIYRVQITGLNDHEQEELYKSLDMTSFVLDKPTYENALLQKIDDIKKNQARGKLLLLWKDKTNTDSPYAWSQLHRTPILALVADSLYVEAKNAFTVINDKFAITAAVEMALDFFQVHPEVFEPLNDTANIEATFRKKILGKYVVVLQDLNAVRDTLQQTLGFDVFNWMGDPRLEPTVRLLAESEYNKNYAKSLGVKIDKMSANEAKTYLKKLVSNGFEVGVEILSGK